MIITFLTGGLGNQMFQFAAGKALALKLKQELKLDISNYSHFQPNETIREFELAKVFQGTFEIAEPKDLKKVLGWKTIFHQHPFLRKIFRKVAQNNNWVVEPGFGYWPDFFSRDSACLIEGYWQTKKYFESYADEIRESFRFKLDDFKNPELINKIENSNSISIHIRRGDFATHKATNNFHGICGSDYYLKAIEEISQKKENANFFVFSDDIEAAKELLKNCKNTYFVDENSSANSHFDMMLMSRCKHHIIANSTFSWWGAWLNTNPDKTIIAPAQWFANGLSDSDLIPSEWLRI